MAEPELNPFERIRKLAKKDPRYQPEAYHFVFRALEHTLRTLKQQRHISGQELLSGIKELAIEEFGLMAKTVLNCWGVRRTDDFGEIVFNLVEEQLMGKTDQDRREDFAGGYDFDEVFDRALKLDLRIDPEAKGKGPPKGKE